MTASTSAISRALVAEIQKRILPELRAMAVAARADGEGMPSIESLRALVKRMRRSTVAQRRAAVEALCALLEDDDVVRAGVRAYAARISVASRTSTALADLGLLPAHGFFAELRQRVAARVLPSHRPPHDLSEILQSVFDPIDAVWLATVDDPQLTRLLGLFTPDDERAARTLAQGALRAIDLLSHRLAAAGEDPVLGDFDPDSLDFESPFLAQADQVLRLTSGLRSRLGLDGAAHEPSPGDEDDRHARVLLKQCSEAVVRVRKRVPKTGATLRLTYELERIEDLVQRLSLLLETVSREREVSVAARTRLFRRLVVAQGEIEQILPLLSRGSKLITSEIVSHAGRTGEHYIARTAREYGAMWLAAGGAGLVIAFLACFKVGLAVLQAPPLVEAALFSANYALGFVVVQLLGMTIATKQPAMTAAALAGSVDGAHPNDTRPLVETIQCLVRSQLAAILGNCLVALPAAIALSALFAAIFGVPVASVVKAHHLLEELDPIHGLAIPHAAITGLWLTTSGVVAGYASASVMARHVPERMRRSVGLARLVGARNAERLGHFVETKAGAMMGSIVLGILLGSTGTIGHLLGLPIDIRHVSFASANLGLAIATLGPGHVDLALCLAGVAGIGLTNLTVSFSLSLGLALHARHASVRDLPTLARDLVHSVFRELPSWMLPVGASATPVKAEG